MSNEITVISTDRITTDSNRITQRVSALTIASNRDPEEAAGLLRSIKTVRGMISDMFERPIKAAYDAYKSRLDARKMHETPLIAAESELKKKMADYNRAQEQARREEELRLREAARKQEEERRIAEAEALEKSGEKQAAEALLSEKVVAPTIIVPKATPKIEGVSSRKVWKYRIVDADKIPRAYLIPDEKKIGAVVRALGEQARIDGVEIYSEDVISAKGF